MWVPADAEQGYVLGSFRLVGGVEIRQHRVSSESCFERRFLDDCAEGRLPNGTMACLPRFDMKGKSCYSEFTVDLEDRSPFGPVDDHGRPMYQWTDGHSLLKYALWLPV